MKDQPSAPAELEHPTPDETQRHSMIRRHLTQIQNSHTFCNSSRAKEFLSYVVEHALDGQTELLKERSIGVNLFRRAPTYITGDDPIVRVKAAEVRKRLAQYYAEEAQSPEVRIAIPVGSYIPRFHWRTSPETALPTAETPVAETIALRPKSNRWRIAILVAVALVLGGIWLASSSRSRVQQRSQLDEFWAPLLAAGQPVLICVPSPVLYYPDLDLYQKASRGHPELYDSTLQRAVNPLQLDPGTSLQWKDIEPRTDMFVNKAHIYNVAILSAFFERIHKTSEVKVGNDYSYNDLQNSPAILLGAFDNPWSVRMTADLPFYFDHQDSKIMERGGQSRIWSTPGDAGQTKDFALIARLLNSKTGQFQVILGGIATPATVAAGKLVTRPNIFESAIRSAPRGWQNKNLEFVIETDVIDGADSVPRVIAVASW